MIFENWMQSLMQYFSLRSVKKSYEKGKDMILTSFSSIQFSLSNGLFFLLEDLIVAYELLLWKSYVFLRISNSKPFSQEKMAKTERKSKKGGPLRMMFKHKKYFASQGFIGRASCFLLLLPFLVFFSCSLKTRINDSRMLRLLFEIDSIFANSARMSSWNCCCFR